MDNTIENLKKKVQEDVTSVTTWSSHHFPKGSVVAKVTGVFAAVERAEFVLSDDSKVSNTLETSTVCDFYGCISGQQELEWKIGSWYVPKF